LRDSNKRYREWADWLDELFADQEGYICLSIKPLRGGWENRFFAWRTEKREAVTWIAEHLGLGDLYVSPAIFDRRRRTASAVLGAQALWADVDRLATVETQQHLDALLPYVTILESGRRGHIHVFVHLAKPVSAQRCAELNRALQDWLGADSPKQGGVLRIPWTFNFKPLRDDDRDHDPEVAAMPREPVGVELKQRSRQRMSTRALVAMLPTVARGDRSKRARKSPLEPADVPDELPHVIERRLSEQPLARGPLDEGRSGQEFALTMLCLEHGYTAEEALAIALGHAPSVAKYGDYLDQEIARIYEKHDHVGMKCYEAQCANSTASKYDVAEQIRQWEMVVVNWPWPTRTRTTMLKLVGAIASKMREVNSTEIDYAERDMEPDAAIARSSVRLRKRDLIAAGLLIDVPKRGSKRDADRFRLPASVRFDPHIPQPAVAVRPKVYGADRTDVFSHGGLGGSCHLIFRVLEDGKFTVEEIRQELSNHAPQRRCVEKWLLKMLELAMVVQVANRRWTVADDIDWAAVRDSLPTAGRSERRHQRIADERKAFDNLHDTVDKYTVEHMRRVAQRYEDNGESEWARVWIVRAECAEHNAKVRRRR
jgi:hypothetical protein